MYGTAAQKYLMLNKVSKALFLEFILAYFVLFRLVYFYRFTLNETIESVRAGLGGVIHETEAHCDRMANILVTLQDEAFSTLSSRAQQKLAHDMHTCTVELADLHSFAWTANSVNLYRYILRPNSKVTSIAMETLRRATTPASAYRCNRSMCIDWVSALSPSPLASVLFGWLDGTSVIEEVLVFSLVVALTGFILWYVIKRILTTCGTSCTNPLLIRICAGLILPISSKFRVHRCVMFGLAYLSAFTVTEKNVEYTVLVRALFAMTHGSLGGTLALIAAVTGGGVFLALSASDIALRLTAQGKEVRLSTIDRQVALDWVHGCPGQLERLNPFTLVSIIRLAGVDALNSSARSEVLRLLKSNRAISGLYHHRHSFKESDPSEVAEFARSVRSIQSTISGHQKVSGVIFAIPALVCLLLVLH